MTSQQLRQKFLEFYKKNDHVIIPSAPLIPSEEEQLTGKEKVLFTSAGMQPLIPYLMGKPHPQGKRLADVQKCLRTDDIEEVGDAVHHTFFEMLGNWSLGDYWKDEAIRLSFKFLTEELKTPKELLAVSVFAGDEDAPRDEESANKWRQLGISEKRIVYLGKDNNFWPTNPAAVGPCGPDTEMFIWTGSDTAPQDFDPEDRKWVEVWNDVFMEFNRKDDGTLEDLPQKNVDTGMGLERMLAVLNGKDNDYETDLFKPIIKQICQELEVDYDQYKKSIHIIADHLKASVFLLKEGVMPGNKLQGYSLRRLLRRATLKAFLINKNFGRKSFRALVDLIINIYPMYFSKEDGEYIETQVSLEIGRFRKTIERGWEEYEKMGNQISGSEAFFLLQSFGFPIELTVEQAKEDGKTVDRRGFEEEFKKHQEISRSSTGIFKGGLADHSDIVIKYHTATHLLHQALRDVLGPEVFQKGSNITAERLRFDFSFDRRLTEEEIKQVEEIINQRISEDLKVDHLIVPLDQAKKMNAIGLFNEKYAEKVSLYGIGKGAQNGYYSLEFCGGPHIEKTGVIGRIKIVKEEAISAGIRRIRAQVMIR